MSHELHLWTDERKVGVIAHDAKDDCWSIAYDKAWVADPDSFPLSPALPLVRPETGYSSNALKRFIEHLLPEGRALAMAYGDVFVHEEVSAFALADFATRCGIDRKLMRREGQRLARLAIQEAALQAESGLYLADERSFIQGIAQFVTRQALRLSKLVSDASAIKADYL